MLRYRAASSGTATNTRSNPTHIVRRIFATRLGELLTGSIERRFPREHIERRQIKFDSHKKEPEEWLLDILWCNEVQPDCKSASKHPSKICAALECESSTSGKGFFEDFATLIHVHSDIKLFLAGVNQVRKSVMCNYISKRKREAAQFLSNWARDLEAEEWYLAFWPSPKDGKWKILPNHRHLQRVYVFELEDREFVRI